MKKDSQYWIEEWQRSKNFRVEKDRIKPKSYLFSSFPKTNLYGFQDGNIRGALVGDFFSRYERMDGKNVLFPLGFDSLGLSSYLENKRLSSTINDDISFVFEEQMLKLGIGLDQEKKIDLKHEDFLEALQLAFIELYERGYIQFGEIDVFQDKSGKKIFDSYFHKKTLYPNRVRAFYLNISEIMEGLLHNIKDLNTTDEVKAELTKMLEIKESLEITFAVTNGSKLKYTFKEPEYIGGISYILIHPDYIDFEAYTQYEEFSAIELYLSSDNTNDFGVFTGNYAINPLTGKKIPIFLSINEDCPVYFANPYLNSKDRIVAQEERLPIIDVVQNGVFIESDFLNGIPVLEGRDLIIEQFVKADIATTNSYYSKDKILLSSLDALGALIPFFMDQEEHLYSLKKHLPFVLSNKFRPVLSDDIDVPGNMISGSMNHIFSAAMLPFLAILYDNVGESTSIFSDAAIHNFKLWNGMELLAISKDELYENVFVSLCIKCIIEKEKKVGLPNLFHKLILIHPTFDEQYHKLSKANNNLLDFEKELDRYSGDAMRMYFLSKPLNQDFIYSETELASIKNLTKSIEELYMKPFAKEDTLEEQLQALIHNALEALKDKNITLYTTLLIDFFKENLWQSTVTGKHGLIYLKLLYPVCPFLAEDIYLNVYKGKYLISDDGWIV